MDDDALDELLWHIEETGGRRKAEAFEAAADELGPDEHGRGALLVAAAEHRSMAGETDEAHRLLDRAEAEGAEPSDGIAPTRLDLALTTGDREQADAVLGGLRAAVRDDALITLDYERVAGVLEAHEDLRGALRWYTMPFTHADPDDPDLDPYCLAGRFRVRRRLGLALDAFDRRAAADGVSADPV